MSLGDMPAGEGFSVVAVSALGAFGALALIFAVLFIMNKIYEKKRPNEHDSDENKDETEKDKYPFIYTFFRNEGISAWKKCLWQ